MIKPEKDSKNQFINNNINEEYKVKRFISDKMEAKKIHKLLMILLLQNQEIDIVKEIELLDPKH